jgi:large subunit ribosomal protein L4
MTELKIYDKQGKNVGTRKLGAEAESFEIDENLVAWSVKRQLSNARRPVAKVKTRSEVAGGGRKPWRQKGTGRARVGTIRSPIWRGGGVTHGPTGKENYKTKMNRKQRAAALASAWKAKIVNDEVVLLKSFKWDKYSTKDAAGLFSAIHGKGSIEEHKTLYLVQGEEEKFLKSISNLPRVKTLPLERINAFDLLAADVVVIGEEGFSALEERFFKS